MTDLYAEDTYTLVTMLDSATGIAGKPVFEFMATPNRITRYDATGKIAQLINLIEQDHANYKDESMGNQHRRTVNKNHTNYDKIGDLGVSGKILTGGRRRPSRKYKKSKRVMRRKSRSTRRR